MTYRGKPPGDGDDGAPSDGLNDDLLHGADEISGFMFGDPTKRRRIYHLVATTKIPVFRLGTMICARRRVLLAWIEEQEGRVPPGIGGHHRRKDKSDETTPAPAGPPLPRRSPKPTGATDVHVPTDGPQAR